MTQTIIVGNLPATQALVLGSRLLNLSQSVFNGKFHKSLYVFDIKLFEYIFTVRFDCIDANEQFRRNFVTGHSTSD